MYTIHRESSDETVVRGSPAYSLKLTVSGSSSLYPDKVLVFQKGREGSNEAWFTSVASASQLLEYPEDAAEEGEEGLSNPYFRLDTVTLVSRRPEELLRIFDELVDEVFRLRRAIDALETLAEDSDIEV